jgi:HPr kinase/phosphorylase
LGTVHATCVVIGEAGVLLRGPSGSGKSALARRLVEGATERGRFARLVSDDRVEIAACHGRIVARAVPAIAGRMEARGLGLIAVGHESAAVLRLLVDCLDQDPPRWPEDEESTTLLDGVSLRRMAGRATPDFAGLILRRLLTDPGQPTEGD